MVQPGRSPCHCCVNIRSGEVADDDGTLTVVHDTGQRLAH